MNCWCSGFFVVPHSSKGCCELFSAAASSVGKEEIRHFKFKLLGTNCRGYIKQLITIYTAIYQLTSYFFVAFSKRKWVFHWGCDPIHDEDSVFVTQRNLLNHFHLRLTSVRSLNFKSKTHPCQSYQHQHRVHKCMVQTVCKWTLATGRRSLLSTTETCLFVQTIGLIAVSTVESLWTVNVY